MGTISNEGSYVIPTQLYHHSFNAIDFRLPNFGDFSWIPLSSWSLLSRTLESFMLCLCGLGLLSGTTALYLLKFCPYLPPPSFFFLFFLLDFSEIFHIYFFLCCIGSSQILKVFRKAQSIAARVQIPITWAAHSPIGLRWFSARRAMQLHMFNLSFLIFFLILLRGFNCWVI